MWKIGLWVIGLLLGQLGLGAAERGFVFEIEAANPEGGMVQLFFNTGQMLTQRDSAGADLKPGEAMQTLRFALPAQPIKLLRLDPANGPCHMRIGRMRLLAADGRVLQEIGPECLRPMWQIASLKMDPGGRFAVVRSQPAADDPMLLIDAPLQALTQRELGRTLVGPRTVLALGLLVAVAMILAVVGAVRSALAAVAVELPRAHRWLGWAVFLGVALVVTGARLAWLKEYGSPVPFWDEWEADGLYILMPLRGHYLDWQSLFIPQNEHRILLTRLLTLVTTMANGEWDPRISMTVGALFCGLTFALIAALTLQAGRWVGIVAAILLAAVGAMPVDFANIFWGGQCIMYALVLLTTCTLVLATAPEIRPWVPWCAAVAAGLALFTLGSGLVVPALGFMVCAARLATESGQRRQLLQLLAVFGVAAAAGLWLKADSHYHASDYAHTVPVFLRALVGFGAWPLPMAWGWLLLRFSPWLLLAIWLAWRRQGRPLDWAALGLGAWAALNAAGLAYGRPDMAPPADTRHFTALMFGLVAMIVCAAALGSALWPARPRWRRIFPLGAGLAVAISFAGLYPWILSGLAGTRTMPQWMAARDQLLLPFLRTGDRALMQDLPADGRCPYWNSAILASLLESPLLQPVLPAKLRKAVAERPGSAWRKEEIGPGFWTLTARTLMKLGWVLVAAGGLLLASVMWIPDRKDRSDPRSC